MKKLHFKDFGTLDWVCCLSGIYFYDKMLASGRKSSLHLFCYVEMKINCSFLSLLIGCCLILLVYVTLNKILLCLLTICVQFVLVCVISLNSLQTIFLLTKYVTLRCRLPLCLNLSVSQSLRQHRECSDCLSRNGLSMQVYAETLLNERIIIYHCQ